MYMYYYETVSFEIDKNKKNALKASWLVTLLAQFSAFEIWGQKQSTHDTPTYISK